MATEWRLYPPPVTPSPPLVVRTKVFIRPKSAKELGRTGRIVAFTTPTVVLPPDDDDDNDDGEASAGPSPENGEHHSSSAAGISDQNANKKKTRRKKKKKRRRHESTRAVVRVPVSDEGGGGSTTSDAPGRHHDFTVRPSRLVPVYSARRPSSLTTTADEEATTVAVAGANSADSDSAAPNNNTRGGGAVVMLTAATANYRSLASSQLQRPAGGKGDDDGIAVLEIGCSTGECTAVLSRYAGAAGRGGGTTGSTSAGRVVAFDTGADMIAKARERIESLSQSAAGAGGKEEIVGGKAGYVLAPVTFHRIDPFRDPKGAVRAAAFSDRTPSAVFIDIGGNREVRNVVRMLDWVLRAFFGPSSLSPPPGIIVVKSEELVDELLGGGNKASSTNGHDTNDHASNGDAGGSGGRRSRPSIDNDGFINGGDVWFKALAQRLSTDTGEGEGSTKSEEEMRRQRPANAGGPPKYVHPIKAPMSLSPTDGVTPICRFHNYHSDGCKRGEKCQFDHAHCHWCLRPGHVALDCTGEGT